MTVRRSRFMAYVLLGVVLTSCATAPPQPGAYGSPAAAAESERTSVMGSILSALALPIFIPFKVAVCAATVVFVAPAAAVVAVSDSYGTGWQRDLLNEGFSQNCGPPWLP